MTTTDFDFSGWVRPELIDIKPYASARSIGGDAGAHVPLNANESPWPVDPNLPLNRYPEPQPKALLSAMSAHFGVEKNELLMTRGSDEGIDLLLRLMARPGVDWVMVHPPCFGMYALYAKIQGAKVMEVPLVKGNQDWAMDWPAMEKAPDCRIYFFCTPNNPTGNVIDPVEIIAWAKKVQGHGLVVVDEAYAEFVHQDSASGSLIGAIAHQPNIVVLRTLSKAFGLAGARLGAVLAHANLIDWLRRIIAPYPLPTPCVDAALQALTPVSLATQAEWIERLEKNKRRLCQALRSMPAIKTLWPGHANFVLVEVDDANALMNHCLEEGIVLRNQSHQQGLDQCIRITIGDEQQTDRLIESLSGFAP